MNIKTLLIISIGVIGLLGSCKKDKKPENTQGNQQETKDTFRMNPVGWATFSTDPFEGAIVSDVAMHKGNHYVSTGKGIYVSSNGTDYSFMEKINAGQSLVGIHLHPVGDYLYAFSEGTSVFRLNGNNWDIQNIPQLAVPLKSQHHKMVQSKDGTMYLWAKPATTEGVLLKSTNNGGSWVAISKPSGLVDMDVYYPNQLVGISENTVFHSTDTGKVWNTVSGGHSTLRSIASNPTKPEIYTYDVTKNNTITGSVGSLNTTFSNMGNHFVIGYNPTGILLVSDISNDKGEYVQYSTDGGKNFLAPALSPSFTQNAQMVGGAIMAVTQNQLIYLADGLTRFKLFGMPKNNCIDFYLKGDKIVSLGENTLVYISQNKGKTWDIGSIKAPFSAKAKCLFVDPDDQKIWIGTTAGLIVADEFASSILTSYNLGLNNFHIGAISHYGNQTALAINRNDLKENSIAFSADGKLDKYTLYQIPGKQNLAISYLSLGGSLPNSTNITTHFYGVGFSVWYKSFALIRNGRIETFSHTENDFFGGNAILSVATNVKKQYTLRLYQNNYYQISKNNLEPSTGKLNIPMGNSMNQIFIDEEDYGVGLVNKQWLRSSGPLTNL